MRIYWVSKDRPLPGQLAELRRLFGEDMRLIRDPNPFDSAKDIAARFRRSKCQDLVALTPLSVLDHLCREGLAPLRPEMETLDRDVEDPDREFRTQKGLVIRFVEFRRVVKLELVTEAVRPCEEKGNR